VGTDFIDHFKEGKTKLALAFLNEKNDASYTFYQDYPEQRLNIKFPGIIKDDIILCGSIYAITYEIRKKFMDLISMAKKNGAIVIYDPNFRPSHSSDLDKLLPLIVEKIFLEQLHRMKRGKLSANIVTAWSILQTLKEFLSGQSVIPEDFQLKL